MKKILTLFAVFFIGILSAKAANTPTSYTYQGTTLWFELKHDRTSSRVQKATVVGVSDRSNVDTIVIPTSFFSGAIIYYVTAIGDSAFMNCSNLTSVTIPNSVRYIDDAAFNGCSSLTNVTIPDSVWHIGSSAFKGCSSLINITIPELVNIIYPRTFFDCSSLINIEIPNSIKKIDTSAFANCSNLINIEIPDSVTYIGDSAFYNCNSIDTMIFRGGTPPTIEGEYALAGNVCLVPCNVINDYINASYFSEHFEDHISTYDILSTEINATISSSETYNLNGVLLYQAGIYTAILQNIRGCDSVVTLTLSVKPPYTKDTTVTICDNQVYIFEDTILTVPGIYTRTLQATNGGDSVITLTLNVIPTFDTIIEKVIYEGNTLDFIGNKLTNAGTYNYTWQTINGCDSIVSIKLFTLPKDTITLTLYDTITNTLIVDNYIHDTTTVENTITLFDTINTTDTLIVTNYDTVTLTKFDTINTTDTLIVNNYIHDTTVIENTITLFDTINTTDTLIVNNYIHDTTIVENTITLFDTINTTDTLIITLYDTITNTIHDTIINTITDTITQLIYDTIIPCARIYTYIYATINEGEKYSDYGFTKTEAGTYTNIFKTEDGCDSTVVLYLTVLSGLDNVESSQIMLYPNPTNEKVYLSLTNIQDAEITIRDIMGNIVKKEKVLANETEVVLDVKNLASGTYTIMISNDKTRVTKKLIKR